MKIRTSTLMHLFKLNLALAAFLFSLSQNLFCADYSKMPDSDRSSGEKVSRTYPRASSTGEYRYDHVTDYAFISLPYEDIDESSLTRAQRKVIASELKRRIMNYERAISLMKDRLAELGYPVEETPKQATPSEKPAAKQQAQESPKEEVSKSNVDMMFKSEDGREVDASNSVLITQHKSGSGTAFIAEVKGRCFIVTNLHVVAQNEGLTFTTKAGANVSFPNVIFIAKDQDAVLIPISEIPEGVTPLKIMDDVAKGVKVGDSVVACGNSEGGEVLRRSPGEVLAIGPSVLETSCSIFKGNSGSPVFHQKSGQVIGVISHATVAKEGLDTDTRKRLNSPIKNKIRYFGQRIDNTKNWERMTLTELNQQSNDLSVFARKLEIIQEFEKTGKISLYDDLNYSDYHKITRILSGTVSSKGAVNTARRQYYEKTANLLRQEIAQIRARKFSPVFSKAVAQLIKSFELQRELCVEREKAQDL